MNLKGTYTTAEVFTVNSEAEANKLVRKLCSQPCMKETQVCVMPDYHVANGTVVGLTVQGMKQLIPNLLGNDLGCGVLVCKLKESEMDFARLDQFVVRQFQPVLGQSTTCKGLWEDCPSMLETHPLFLRNRERYMQALGTLGFGNHFIEVDRDEKGVYYLLIHTGSRSFGKQITSYYQEQARNALDFYDQIHRPKHLACLPESMREDYLRDVMAAQQFADWNRYVIREAITSYMGWTVVEEFTTMHNYIDVHGIVRKGAIAAEQGQRLVIPLNMQEGSLICTGLGNSDWNCSAPHGLGRKMSRTKAKEVLDLQEFQQSMQGIYSSSVGAATLEEAPAAYKNSAEVIALLEQTVQVNQRLTPVYNFKAV